MAQYIFKNVRSLSPTVSLAQYNDPKNRAYQNYNIPPLVQETDVSICLPYPSTGQKETNYSLSTSEGKSNNYEYTPFSDTTAGVAAVNTEEAIKEIKDLLKPQ